MAARRALMAVREEDRRGKRILVIDIGYKKPDGSWARYRRDSEAATKTAAREEERRIKDRIARTGSAFEAPPPEETPAAKPTTFADVVEQYRTTFMITDLKVTTRRGYGLVLDGVLLPRFKDHAIAAVDGDAASKLDLELTKEKLARNTRNNAQIVLRSVLRFAVEKKYLIAMPSGLPRLKQPEPSILEIPSDDQVAAILALSCPTQRRAFGLMAYGGLRPNEVRALPRRDMKLRREGGVPVGGFLCIREGFSYGETHTPKTGKREVPLARPLALLLGEVEEGPRDGYVALTAKGKRWGQYGLDNAFEKVRNRAGLAGWSVYALRHYAITTWLRKGIPVHVVQKMAGHRNLATTQHYVHYLKADLEDAARRLNGNGNMLETPSPAP
jgi:integrase